MVVDVQASVGIALFPEHGHGVETLLQKADVAMYRAKETRSDVALYDERHDHHSPAKLALTAELRTAVDSEEIVLWYQPELDLRTREVMAVEALVRWDHPRLGVLPPSSFVRMAEATNLIKPLTQRVMEVALLQVADWHAMGLEIAVAVNISAQVLVDQSFTQQVVAALRRTGVAPQRLKLEVTETALMSDPVTARTVLRELEALGCEISIDDFGTGYSSLAYLADLPVSEVKIDRSFVSRMSAGSSEKVIVNSTIDLAHHLGLRAVAEGVEDWSMLPELEALGCDAAQGYAISHPLAAARRHPLDAGLPQHLGRGAGRRRVAGARDRTGGMILIVFALLCLLSVPLTGGRLGRLASIRLRGTWVPVVALAIQVLITTVIPDGHEELHKAVHIATYVLIGVFLWSNRRLPGVKVIGLGAFLNALVITVNGGQMAASRTAERLAGLHLGAGFENSAPLAHPHLLWFGDVIPWPGPFPNVLSIGDLPHLRGHAHPAAPRVPPLRGAEPRPARGRTALSPPEAEPTG